MVIDLNSSSAQQALTAREKVSTQRSNGAAPATSTPIAPVQKDTVELSDTARALKAADAQIANTSKNSEAAVISQSASMPSLKPKHTTWSATEQHR